MDIRLWAIMCILSLPLQFHGGFFFLIHVKMNNKRQTIVRCIVEAGVVLPYVNIPIFV